MVNDMRIAVIADIHGNLPALEAILADEPLSCRAAGNIETRNVGIEIAAWQRLNPRVNVLLRRRGIVRNRRATRR